MIKKVLSIFLFGMMYATYALAQESSWDIALNKAIVIKTPPRYLFFMCVVSIFVLFVFLAYRKKKFFVRYIGYALSTYLVIPFNIFLEKVAFDDCCCGCDGLSLFILPMEYLFFFLLLPIICDYLYGAYQKLSHKNKVDDYKSLRHQRCIYACYSLIAVILSLFLFWGIFTIYRM